jgi:3-deoxy-D-manno-octulosonate 8-phosphate phosphatase (KDO 8-P phosphatase)
MSDSFDNISSLFKGRFIVQPQKIVEKLKKCKAYIFDWDGVFNNGYKDDSNSSPFSEIDSMGLNMLRFNHYLRAGTNPVVAIITGESNNLAYNLAKREHFHSVYFKIKNKVDSLNHICKHYNIKPDEVAFVFDDILDLSAAPLAGVRIMVPHASTLSLVEFAIQNNLADYITHCDGHQNAVRETSELLMALSGRYDETISNRVEYSDIYKEYFEQRQSVKTSFYTIDSSQTILPTVI